MTPTLRDAKLLVAAPLYASFGQLFEYIGGFMILYDNENKKIIKSIDILLTPEEMKELGSDAINLSENIKLSHSHINNKDFTSHLNLSVYSSENLNSFNAEFQEFIKKFG